MTIINLTIHTKTRTHTLTSIIIFYQKLLYLYEISNYRGKSRKYMENSKKVTVRCIDELT